MTSGSVGASHVVPSLPFAAEKAKFTLSGRFSAVARETSTSPGTRWCSFASRTHVSASAPAYSVPTSRVCTKSFPL